MEQENKDQIIIPKISHDKFNRNYKKFLRRHGWQIDNMDIKPKGKYGQARD